MPPDTEVTSHVPVFDDPSKQINVSPAKGGLLKSLVPHVVICPTLLYDPLKFRLTCRAALPVAPLSP